MSLAFNSRMAARAGISQARALVHTDDLADEVDAATLKAWNRILRLLRMSPPPPDLQKRLAEMLRGISTGAISRLTDGMTKLAKITHRQQAMDLVVESPRAVIALALQTTAVKEAKLTPAESAQVQAQLIPPITQTEAEEIVNAPSKGTTWQARIQAQTGLGSPDQIAAIVAMQAAQGATVQQLTAALAPIVQGNRVTARRVARTEGLRVAHAARMQAFDGLGDMLIGYQIHGTMDWRIRPHHALRNGNVYKITPAPGELSVADDMPHPPMEADGSVAFNCRCYLSPVLSMDPDIENDPAAKALFLTNDKKLIPDPVVYSEWFDTATEQERRWAVGAGRLKAATDRLAPGEALTWSAVLDPLDGQLVPVEDIKNESDDERKSRMDGVAAAIQTRRDLGIQVARFGYLEPPPPPPPPPTPEFSEAETYTNYVGATFKFAVSPDGEKVTWTVKDPDGKPDVTTGYTQNVVELNSIFKTGYFTIYVKPVPPLPDYVTDVDALLKQVSAKGFKPNVHLLKWDDKWLIPAGQYQKYKKGKVSIRTLANIYNKNLAKLKGDVAPGKFDKVTQHIPTPAPAPAPPPVIGMEFHNTVSLTMNGIITAVGNDIKWTTYWTDGSKTGKDDCSATDFTYRFSTGYYAPGFAPGTTPPIIPGATPAPAASVTQSVVDVGGVFHKANKTQQGIVTAIIKGIVSWDAYDTNGKWVSAHDNTVADFNDLFTAGFWVKGTYASHTLPAAVAQFIAPVPANAPAASPASATQTPVAGTLVHDNFVNFVITSVSNNTVYLNGLNKKTGEKDPLLVYDSTIAEFLDQIKNGGLVYGPNPKYATPAAGVVPVTVTQAPAVGTLFHDNFANFTIASVTGNDIKYIEYDSTGNFESYGNVTVQDFNLNLSMGDYTLGPHPLWTAPALTAVPPLVTSVAALPWADALAKAKTETPHQGVWGPKKGTGLTGYGGILFDNAGKIMLRKPTGNYGGYNWTFAKGGQDPGDHSADTAVREVEEETGHKGAIVGYLPGSFSSGYSSTNFYFMKSESHDPSAMTPETSQVVWVDFDEAEKLINRTTNQGGKERDLEILAAAKHHLQQLAAGVPLPTVNSPPVNPPPPPPSIAPAAPPKPSIANLKVSPNLHEPTRWNPIPKAGTNKPALGIKPDANGNRVPHVPAFVPKARPTAPHKSTSGPVEFPKNPAALTAIRVLGGSTGAELVSDPATGRKFVRKMGASPEHLAEEVAADKIYAACGVAVPSVDTHTVQGKPVKLAEVIDGATYKEYQNTATKTQMERLDKKLQQNFAADALLGNWDVMGMGNDNVMVTPAGEPIRIDNGGSLRYRAQGGKKNANWNAFPSELWSMSQDPPGGKAQGAGANSVRVFGGLTWGDTVGQIEGLVQSRQQILDAATDLELKKMLGLRLDQFADIAATSRMLLADGWSEEYVKKVTQHQCQYRQSGLVAKLPKILGDVNGANKIDREEAKDENGKPFDDLRGQGLSGDIRKYIDANGGKMDFVETYARGQAGSSSSDGSIAAKQILVKNRPGVKPDSYYWDYGSNTNDKREQTVKEILKNTRTTEKEATESLAMLAAWSMELLRNVDMPNNNRQAGVMRVYRTETGDALPKNLPAKCPAPDKPKILKADQHNVGALESYAAFKPVQISNSKLIIKEVPYHRILGVYLMSLGGRHNGAMFAGDHENEFICMADNIETEYYGAPSLIGLTSWSHA